MIDRRTLMAAGGAALAAPALPRMAEARPIWAGAPAPDWDVAAWLNSAPVSLDGLRGRVVLIDFFQLWCPACKAFTLPLMLTWRDDTFAQDIADGRLAIVGIHSVFEGHDHQTLARLERFVAKEGITHPVGHDRHGIDTRLPNTLILYGVRGTPSTVLVGKDGIVADHVLGVFDPDERAGLIRALMDA